MALLEVGPGMCASQVDGRSTSVSEVVRRGLAAIPEKCPHCWPPCPDGRWRPFRHRVTLPATAPHSADDKYGHRKNGRSSPTYLTVLRVASQSLSFDGRPLKREPSFDIAHRGSIKARPVPVVHFFNHILTRRVFDGGLKG